MGSRGGAGAGQAVNNSVNTVNMKRCLSSSLYWYVEKSLEDMLEGYMLLARDGSAIANDETTLAEINRVIQHMLELPLEFDSTSRQLSVNLMLNFVQRNIQSTKACKYLLVTMLRRKSELAQILKSDLLTLLEEVFFRAVKKEDYLKPEFEDNQGDEEDQIHPKLEGRAYTDILVELYYKEFVSATNVLVLLDRLSKVKPSYYHADLLFLILNKIGASVETKLSRGTFAVRSSSCSGGQQESKSTFEMIYKRLDFLLPYATSSESQIAYKKIISERKKKKSRAKKSRSKEEMCNKNTPVTRGHYQPRQDTSIPEDLREGVTKL